MQFKVISLKDIFLKDERFRISFFFSLDKLKRSLKSIGMTHPLIIVRRNKKNVLVTGWKRILAAKDLSLDAIPVFICDEEDDLRAFEFAVHEKAMDPSLTLLEKAEVISKLVIFGENKKRIIQEICPLMQLPATPGHLDKYRKMSELEIETRRFLHENNVSLPVTEQLLSFPSQERKRLLPLLSAMGQNKQKVILEDLYDLLLREDLKMDDLFNQERFQKVLTEKRLSRLQKADKVRDLIREMRYPALTEMNKTLDRCLKKMHWPKETPLSASPFFEDDRFMIQVPFRNKNEAETLLFKLEKLVATREFSEMMDVLTNTQNGI